MKSIKSILAAISIVLLCINADCNKIEEVVAPSDTFIIEGILINTCDDTSPIKFKKINLIEQNANIGITTTTDSNGYFKFYSKYKGKGLKLYLDGGKDILANLPSMKNLNLGNVVLNFTMPLILKFRNFVNITNNDSFLISFSGNNPVNPHPNYLIKGPFSSENLGIVYLKETPFYDYKDSIKGKISIYKINGSSYFQTKSYLVNPCGVTQEIVFD